MNGVRDDFTKETKKVLQERVGNCCSNPGCKRLTSGPNYDENKATRIGVAAHITAASPKGPRYDSELTADQRKSILNGIWLCENCAALIDKDPDSYHCNSLIRWKIHAEELARLKMLGLPIPPNLESEGYFCPHCDEFVKKNKTICKGCRAEVYYGSIPDEYKNDFNSFAGVGFAASVLFFVQVMPTFNSWLGLNVKLNIFIVVFCLLMIGVSSVLSGTYWAKRNDLRKRKNPPTFRRMRSA